MFLYFLIVPIAVMMTNSLQDEGQKTHADVDLLCAAFTDSMPMCCQQPHYGWNWLMSYQSVDATVYTVPVCHTWSSRGRSQKAGMYLAHSTRTRSCCFMDSHTSVMVAIFLVRMSPLSMGAGEVIWPRQQCVGELLLTLILDQCWV